MSNLNRLLQELASLSDAELAEISIVTPPKVEAAVAAMATMLARDPINVDDVSSSLETALGGYLGRVVFAALHIYRDRRADAEQRDAARQLIEAKNRRAETTSNLEILMRAINPDVEPDFAELDRVFGPDSLTVANIRRLRSARPERIQVGEREFVLVPELGIYLLDVAWKFEGEKFGTTMFTVDKSHVPGTNSRLFKVTLRGVDYTIGIAPFLGHFRIEEVIGLNSLQIISPTGIISSRHILQNGTRFIYYDSAGKIKRVVINMDDIVTTITNDVTTIVSHPMLIRKSSSLTSEVVWIITDGDFCVTIPDSAHEIKGDVHRFTSATDGVETTYEFRGSGSAPNWKFVLLKKETKVTTVADGVQRCSIQIHTYGK